MQHLLYTGASSSAVASSSRVLLCSSARSSASCRPLSSSASLPSPSPAPSSSFTSSESDSPPAPRQRKPKWTKAQRNDRDYVSLGLPPSRPDHEKIVKPLKRKQARALEEKLKEDAEMNGRVRRDGTTWLSAQEFEEKLYREDLKERNKQRQLDELLGTGAVARKRWAWEWFSEGKELKDIGVRMASLVDPPRERPYHEALMAQWVLSHLAAPPRDAPAPTSSSSAPGPTRSKHTNSLHLLTPELWARLTRSHQAWSGYSFASTIGSHIAEDRKANETIFDLLWKGGWRGEGMLDAEEIEKVRHGVRGQAARKELEQELGVGTGGKDGLRLMWDKAGEEIPVGGDVMRKFLGKEWGQGLAMEDLEDWGEVVKASSSDADATSTANKELADASAKDVETALARDKDRVLRLAAARLVHTSRRGIDGGLGTAPSETSRIAALMEEMAKRNAGGEEEAKEFAERTKRMPWWGKRNAVKERQKPVKEAMEREAMREWEGEMSPWGKKGRGTVSY